MKLYVVYGPLGLLIATELLVLLFAMHTLSGARALVASEGAWSKAQKNAVHSLQRYAITRDEFYYTDFLNQLKIPLGARRARIELSKTNPNFTVVRQGLLEAGNHIEDLDVLISALTRFGQVSYVKSSVEVWLLADNTLQDLLVEADSLHRLISGMSKKELNKPSKENGIGDKMHRIDIINQNLSRLEGQFSSSLSEGARLIERTLRIALATVVLLVEGTGFVLMWIFARNLSRSLKDLGRAASEVGKGNFQHSVPVRSTDELGNIAKSINQMIQALEFNIGQRKQAEDANQTKSMFLANMSHEIRTPISVILGLAENIKDETIPNEDRIKYIDTIAQTGQNLNRIVNDILDISKVEQGHLQIQATIFSVKTLLSEIELMMQTQLAKTRNGFSIESHAMDLDMVKTDKVRLQQILVNLLGNANKFTDQGRIKLTYGDRDGWIYFRVEDTGIGLTEAQQGLLFKHFSQADNSLTRKREGSGLGLILSKRLAQAMGGDVVLEHSQPNRGSTFLLRLPNRIRSQEGPTQPKPLHDMAREALQNKRILIVDDTEENQLILKLLLRKHGITNLEFAENGLICVQMASQRPFDLIIMDMQMPVLDGYAATRKLRIMGFQNPIIALTAHAMKDDEDRCLAAGCDAYLSKPLNWGDFNNAIARAFNLSQVKNGSN